MKEINKKYAGQYVKGLETLKSLIATMQLENHLSGGIGKVVEEIDKFIKNPNKKSLKKSEIVDCYTKFCFRYGMTAAYNTVTDQRIEDTDFYVRNVELFKKLLSIL